MFKKNWITFNGKESNGKRERRKIQSTTPENTTSGSGSGSVSVSACGSACDSGSGGEKYEVFLSFRGPDTGKTFVDYLFEDLKEKNIRTFKDDEELTVGKKISPELRKAIDESKIYIPILSPNYASSKSCLLEIAHMVRCDKTGGKIIIPVFYDVEPSDVRHQRGRYKKAFRQHKKNFDQETIQDWKDALKVVGELKGRKTKDTDGYEGKLAKMVAEEVLKGLKKNYMHVPKTLVGMDHHVDKMRGLLNVDSNDVRIVGIHGMGGLGKTIIAKVIYNQLCDNFECCCFLEDIREASQQKGLVYLQSQLLSRILKGKGRVIDNVDHGIEEIRAAVRGKKILIVLDDVDEKSQFDKFADNCDFGSGSRIIITTRNLGVLNELKKKGQLDFYEPECMKDDDSLQLFSKHAFNSLSPPEDYDTLSKEIVSSAAGLPLVLVVTGSSLSGANKNIWKEAPKRLKNNIPDREVQKKLRISYDPLDKEQQQLFLDIACLFVGEDKTNLLYMWDDLETRINELVLKSLIKVGEDNRIWMHDQVRDLGRRIVDEESSYKEERSRLWRPEEALSILESRTGTSNVVALCLGRERPCLKGKDFKKLPNLRYLSLGYGVYFDGDFADRFSNLRWLQFLGCPWTFRVTNLALENLVVLKLTITTTSIRDDLVGWSEIEMAAMLKVLDLSRCQALTRVNCSTFTTLESSDLCGCLAEIEGLGELISLESLHHVGCKSIEKLPDLSNLRMLKHLMLSGHVKLLEVEGLVALESLEELDMSGYTSLKKLKLPDLSSLEKLRHIDVSKCVKLTEIRGFEELKSLKSLHLSGCKSIKKLPDLSNLGMLEHLMLSWCVKLLEVEGLAALKSLKELDMSGCTSLQKLPDLSSLENLRVIDVSGCVKLTEIRGLGELKSLESLQLGGCESIEKVPDLSNLRMLKHLMLSGYMKLLEVDGLAALASLEQLDMSGCTSLKKLPDLSSLENLRKIDVSGCVKLTEIGGLGELKSLESLILGGCESIEKLPDLSSLTNLRWIDVFACVKLTEIRGLGELKSLGWVDIRESGLLGNPPCLPNIRTV